MTNQNEKSRKRYSLEFKNRVILNIEQLGCSLRQMSVRTGVDRRIIASWIKKKKEIGDAVLQRFKYKVYGPSSLILCEVMEEKLKMWMKEERAANKCLDSASVQRKASQIYDVVHPVNPTEGFISDCNKERKPFKASRGWLSNFLMRNRFCLRRVSTSGRDLPKDVHDQIFDFFTWISALFEMQNITKEQIINMDETAVYLDCPSNYTYAEIGSRRVEVNTTGMSVLAYQ